MLWHFGVSTNDLGALKAFDMDGNCATCQLDFSLRQRLSERAVLPNCAEGDVGPIVRRRLEKGILSGTMRKDQRFTDWVRRRRNSGPEREAFKQKVQLATHLAFLDRPGLPMTQAAIPFILRHPAVHGVRPGASRLSRLDTDVAALERVPTADDRAQTGEALDMLN